jgi:cytochrome P450
MELSTEPSPQVERETEALRATGSLPRLDLGRLETTVRLHRDPLGFLRATQARLGDVFALTLTTGTQLVLADPAASEQIAHSDPARSHAGSARRRVLPVASTRSVFGGDREEHDAARSRVQSAFTPQACARRAGAIACIAERHLQRWPRGRPFRLLPRMRLLADEIFASELLGAAEPDRALELARAIRRMLWTPGNPPLTIPAREQGVLGRLVDVVYRRRARPLAALLRAQLGPMRQDGSKRSGLLGLLADAEPDTPDEELVDELLALLMAAQEPMAAGLTWIALCLSRDLAIQDRLAAEGVDSPFGRAAVSEALRLHPPAVAVLRRLHRPTVLAGYSLPGGASVMAPLVLVNRDARVFEAPEEFRPERHLGEEPERPVRVFGSGSRSCLGQFLARTEIAAVLRVLLDALRLRPPPSPPERMVLRATILVPQRSGLAIASDRRAISAPQPAPTLRSTV